MRSQFVFHQPALSWSWQTRFDKSHFSRRRSSKGCRAVKKDIWLADQLDSSSANLANARVSVAPLLLWVCTSADPELFLTPRTHFGRNLTGHQLLRRSRGKLQCLHPTLVRPRARARHFWDYIKGLLAIGGRRRGYLRFKGSPQKLGSGPKTP